MLRQVLIWLLLKLCILTLSSCGIESMKRGAHSITIDAMQIEKNLYADLHSLINIEIFFVKNKYFSWNQKQDLNTIFASGMQGVQKYEDVVGYHIYQITPLHIVSDKLFIPHLVKKAFLIVKRHGKIMYSNEINIDPVTTSLIYLKFIGYDLYIKCQ